MFYGVYEFHLSLEEIDLMTLGEMIDLLNCLAVYKGAAEEVKQMTYDELMALE